MDNYLVMIGLEMHCEISETKSKAFSSARNDYIDLPNSNIRPVDMAFPGTLPVVNKEAVKKSLVKFTTKRTFKKAIQKICEEMIEDSA